MTKRWPCKKGILGAFDFRHTFQMVDFFDIFYSSLRSALTFDIHTRRVPLGLRADAPVMLVCLRLAAGKAAARARAQAWRARIPEKRDMHGISRRSGVVVILVRRSVVKTSRSLRLNNMWRLPRVCLNKEWRNTQRTRCRTEIIHVSISMYYVVPKVKGPKLSALSIQPFNPSALWSPPPQFCTSAA